MAKISGTPGWQRALIVLTGTVVGVVVVSCLYWAQRVLVPVALAVFLTFLLTPLVGFLQRRHLPRTPSVAVVVLLATLVLGGIVWLITAEVSGLTQELPTYTDNIKEKVKSLRQMGHGNQAPGKDDPRHYGGVDVAADEHGRSGGGHAGRADRGRRGETVSRSR